MRKRLRELGRTLHTMEQRDAKDAKDLKRTAERHFHVHRWSKSWWRTRNLSPYRG